jgi:hypothetical protein
LIFRDYYPIYDQALEQKAQDFNTGGTMLKLEEPSTVVKGAKLGIAEPPGRIQDDRKKSSHF